VRCSRWSSHAVQVLRRSGACSLGLFQARTQVAGALQPLAEQTRASGIRAFHPVPGSVLDGATVRLDGRTERVRPTRIARDGPGSGDAFAATLLVALSQGDDLREAVERASQAALDSLA